MALDVGQALLKRFFNEELIELFVLQIEDHVHAGAGPLFNVVVVETVRVIDRVVNLLTLQNGASLHFLDAAFGKQPLADQVRNVDRKGRRCVVHRFEVRIGLIVEHGRRCRLGAA